MATYEFECPKCKERWEVTKPMKDSSREEFCPICHKAGLRIYHPISFTFSPYLKELRGGNMLDY